MCKLVFFINLVLENGRSLLDVLEKCLNFKQTISLNGSDKKGHLV